jgi:hypothetical protein
MAPMIVSMALRAGVQGLLGGYEVDSECPGLRQKLFDGTGEAIESPDAVELSTAGRLNQAIEAGTVLFGAAYPIRIHVDQGPRALSNHLPQRSIVIRSRKLRPSR